MHTCGALSDEVSERPLSRAEAELYLERLNDGRNVILNGERIKYCAQHSALSGAVDGIIAYYGLQQSDPHVHCSDVRGENIAISLAAPRTPTDLQAKRRSFKAMADASFGMLGRTPDFMNSAVMAIAHHSEMLGCDSQADYASNARSLYTRCCQTNLFLAHAAINPQIERDRSLGGEGHDYRAVQIVASDRNGVVVRGAKMIATLAPIADELLVFNMPGLTKGDESYAVAFAVPVNTRGLTIVCRKAFNHPNYSRFDHPLANRFDEIDSYVLFDDVKVPWDKVLVNQNVQASNAFYDATFARNHTGHQGIVRGLAKAEFVVGAALNLAEVLGLQSQAAIQAKLGELASQVEALRALINLAEQDAVLSSAGILTPSIAAIQAFRLLFPPAYRQTLELMRTMAPGSLLSCPNAADFDGDSAALLSKALTTEHATARNRTFALNLAWDLVGDAFGQRQLTYEYYHAGSPEIIARGQFYNYKWEHERRLVASIIGHEFSANSAP
jgi:4-hydroxyphenylacetate 3-monooxygenase